MNRGAKLLAVDVGGFVVTVAVSALVVATLAAKQTEAYESCAPECNVGGPAATVPEVALVVGGVLAATLVFVALGMAFGDRSGEEV